MSSDAGDLRTCPHGLTYDAREHIGCVVCRREAGLPSAAPLAPAGGGARATKVIWAGIGGLALVVALGIGASKVLDANPTSEDAAAATGLAVTPTATSVSQPPNAAADSDEAIARARGDVPITMYTTTWCPVCVRAKQYMEAQGIRYTERDVEASDSARVACLRLNPRCSVPTIDIDGEVLVGFGAGSIEQAITRAAERRL